jgi:mannuronan 5-epimerase
MKIDSVKITSWNPVKNDYPSEEDSKPRAYISVENEATGTTDIFDSELGYLGYNSSSELGYLGYNSSYYEKKFIPSNGFSYYGGDGSIVRNNNIHNNYFGFYSRGVGNMLIENNHVHHNTYYGLDPHSGTHDMVIRNNTVHHNGKMGIICSQHCRDITIEGNNVFKNIGSGIMLSIDMKNSVVRNNYIQKQENGSSGITISDSDNNQVYGNIVSFSDVGTRVIKNSSNNYVYNNTFQGIRNYPILVRGSDGVNNTFENNDIVNSSNAVRLYNNTESLFVGNNGIDNFSPGHQYVVQGNSTLSMDRTFFPSWTKFKSDNASNNIVNIVNSGIISVRVGEDFTSSNTQIMPFSSRITNGSLQLMSLPPHSTG